MSDRIESIIDALRKKLLDAAIRGELVDQNDEEEPTSVLLDRIAKEHAALPGKRKSGPPSRIERRPDGTFEVFPDGSEKDNSDEIPFDIPKSWEWARMAFIGDWKAGATPSKGDASFYKNGNIPWLKTGDLNDGYVDYIPELITEKALRTCSLRLNPTGSILIAMYGATIGKLGILNFPATTNQACCACITNSCVSNMYLFYYLMSQKQAFTRKGEGGTQPNISKEKIDKHLIPLPPLQEQHRIVSALERHLKQLDILRESHRRVRRILHETPTSLKQQLLQAAIEGKLVAQDPKEEPASALLERIAKERAALPGKRKASLSSRIERRPDGIFELFPDGSEKDISDEIPFDIPESWEWVRLKQIAEIISGTSYKKKDVSNAGIRILRGDNIQNDSLVLKPDDVFIPASYSSPQKRVMAGDIILVGSTGSKKVIGKAAYIKETLKNTQIGAFLRIVRAYQPCYAEYLAHILATSYYRNYIRALASGTNINNIKAQHLEDFLVPLPPLQEQQRIVQRLEELLPLVSQA